MLLAVDVYDLGVDVEVLAEVLADAIGAPIVGVGAPSCQGGEPCHTLAR